MDNKFELVEKYNIDVDVFIDEDGVTPVWKTARQPSDQRVPPLLFYRTGYKGLEEMAF